MNCTRGDVNDWRPLGVFYGAWGLFDCIDEGYDVERVAERSRIDFVVGLEGDGFFDAGRQVEIIVAEKAIVVAGAEKDIACEGVRFEGDLENIFVFGDLGGDCGSGQ